MNLEEQDSSVRDARQGTQALTMTEKNEEIGQIESLSSCTEG